MSLRRPLPAISIVLLAAALALAASSAPAREDDQELRDAVRRAVEAGEVLPLPRILDGVRAKVPGDVTGVEIEHKHDRWRYEFRIIDRTGRVLEVHVDARSGDVEKIEEK